MTNLTDETARLPGAVYAQLPFGVEQESVTPLIVYGSDSPEAFVVAPPGSIYVDLLTTILWMKQAGRGDTGWAEVSPGGSGPLLPSVKGQLLSFSTVGAVLSVGTNGQLLSAASGQATGLQWIDPPTVAPVTTKGDLYGFSTVAARLPVGTNGQLLTAASGQATGLQWVDPPQVSPLTTKGDLYGFSTVNARLAVGADGKILSADSGQATGLAWIDPPAVAPVTTKGDLFGFSTVSARLPVGSNTQMLVADSTQTLGIKWADQPAAYTSPLTTKGDIFVHSTVDARLPIGTDAYILQANSAVGAGMAWADPVLFVGIYGATVFAPLLPGRQLVSSTQSDGGNVSISRGSFATLKFSAPATTFEIKFNSAQPGGAIIHGAVQNSIATVTWTDLGGGTIIGAPTSMTAGQAFAFIYDDFNNYWWNMV